MQLLGEERRFGKAGEPGEQRRRPCQAQRGEGSPQEEPIPSSNGTSSGLDDLDKRLDECFASMAALQSWTVDMKKGLAELQEINNSNRELRNDIRAGLVHVFGPTMLKALQEYMRKEALKHLDVPEEQHASKLKGWQQFWCQLQSNMKQELRKHFGPEILAFIQLDSSNPDISDYGPGTYIVSKSASAAQRALLLNVISYCSTPEAKRGAQAAYSWIYYASSPDAMR